MPNRRTVSAFRTAANDRVMLMDAGTVAVPRSTSARIDPLGPSDGDRTRGGLSGAIVALRTGRTPTM